MGLNPYTHYNIADAELLGNLKSQTGVRAAAARAYFDLKKMLFPHLTLQATLPGVPSWAASQMESNMPGDDSNTGGVGGGRGPNPSLAFKIFEQFGIGYIIVSVRVESHGHDSRVPVIVDAGDRIHHVRGGAIL